MIDMPNPSGYRKTVPAGMELPPVSPETRRVERRRQWVGFGLAVALHAAAIGAWWLTPPLRLVAGIDPARWVPVLSISRGDASKPTALSAAGSAPPPASVSPAATRTKSRPRQPTVELIAVPPTRAAGANTGGN